MVGSRRAMQRYRNLLTFVFSDYRRARYLIVLLLGPFLFYWLLMAVSWVLLELSELSVHNNGDTGGRIAKRRHGS
jgi:hypothetical protein